MAREKSVKYTLQEPFNFGSEEITEIVLKRPKGKHLKKLPMEPTMGDFLDLAARLCDRSPAFIDEMDVIDVQEVAEIVQGFLGNGQKTGGSG